MPRRLVLAAVMTAVLAQPAAAQDHAQHAAHGAPAAPDNPATAGQAAFAAIADAVARLSADPATDWSRVDVGALRAHLVDMDGVFLRARVRTTPVTGGARFEVSGDAEVAGAIQRMTASHTRMADGDEGRHIATVATADGAVMTVTAADAAGVARIRALGFFGLLASGSHHQPHHLMLARGEAMAP